MAPEVLLKFATSLDGCFDDRSPVRARFSGEEDLLAVDELRATFDAILIGAETLRRDNPRLVLRNPELREQRRARGLAADPVKVCITASGRIPLESDFFQTGEGQRLIYTTEKSVRSLQKMLGTFAEVIAGGESLITLPEVLSDLSRRGVQRVMVEGGPTMIEQFLQENLADTFRFAASAGIIGERSAPRLFASSLPPAAMRRRPWIDRVERLGEVFVVFGRFVQCSS